jgi:hypothetical protein
VLDNFSQRSQALRYCDIYSELCNEHPSPALVLDQSLGANADPGAGKPSVLTVKRLPPGPNLKGLIISTLGKLIDDLEAQRPPPEIPPAEIGDQALPPRGVLTRMQQALKKLLQ